LKNKSRKLENILRHSFKATHYGYFKLYLSTV